jgi:hypothetical protein
VCGSETGRDFGRASWREGVPSGRTKEVTARVLAAGSAVIVWTALGVGGAKPPVIPVEAIRLWDWVQAVKLTVLEPEGVF